MSYVGYRPANRSSHTRFGVGLATGLGFGVISFLFNGGVGVGFGLGTGQIFVVDHFSKRLTLV